MEREHPRDRRHARCPVRCLVLLPSRLDARACGGTRPADHARWTRRVRRNAPGVDSIQRRTVSRSTTATPPGVSGSSTHARSSAPICARCRSRLRLLLEGVESSGQLAVTIFGDRLRALIRPNDADRTGRWCPVPRASGQFQRRIDRAVRRGFQSSRERGDGRLDRVARHLEVVRRERSCFGHQDHLPPGRERSTFSPSRSKAVLSSPKASR